MIRIKSHIWNSSIPILFSVVIGFGAAQAEKYWLMMFFLVVIILSVIFLFKAVEYNNDRIIITRGLWVFKRAYKTFLWSGLKSIEFVKSISASNRNPSILYFYVLKKKRIKVPISDDNQIVRLNHLYNFSKS